MPEKVCLLFLRSVPAKPCLVKGYDSYGLVVGREHMGLLELIPSQETMQIVQVGNAD